MRLITLGLVAASALLGNSYSLVTAPGATNGTSVPVDVSVDITTESGMIAITITNNEADPFTIAQVASGLTFSLQTVDSNAISLGGVSGTLIDGPEGKTPVWSATPVVDTTDSIDHWNVNDTVTTVTTVALSSILSGTWDLIIGPTPASGSYSATSGSVTNCHACPYIYNSATFTVDLTGVTSSTTINVANAIISFGTATGENVALIKSVPEPGSLILAFGGAAMVWVGSLRRNRRS